MTSRGSFNDGAGSPVSGKIRRGLRSCCMSVCARAHASISFCIGKQVCSRCRMKQGSTHWWHCWKEQCRRCFPIEDKGGRLKSGHAQDLMLVSLLSFSGLSACSQSNWTSVCINHQDDAILPRKVMVRTCFGSKDAQQQHQELQPTECTRTKVPRVLPARTVFCLVSCQQHVIWASTWLWLISRTERTNSMRC